MSIQHDAEAARNGYLPASTPARPAAPGTGDRLPRPPGRRRPGLAALAVLLIVLGGATAGLLALRVDQRQPVLVARQDIAAGQRISSDDLAVARVAADGLATIPATAAGQVIGQYAASRISAGRLIDDGMLNSSGLLTEGKAAAGVSLQPGHYPASGLESGDVVQVIRSVDGDGKVLSARAIVGSVQAPAEGVFGAGSDAVVVTVIVPQEEAAAVAAAGAAQQVSLTLLRRGQPVDSGQ
jgi:Flp pilus assembly protein CpaB